MDDQFVDEFVDALVASRGCGGGNFGGIQPSSRLINRLGLQNGFENWLVTKLEKKLGRPAVGSFVTVSFDAFPEGDVCRVDVKPSDKPVYAGDAAEFFVRMGNSTRPYNTRDALEYIHTRW